MKKGGQFVCDTKPITTPPLMSKPKSASVNLGNQKADAASLLGCPLSADFTAINSRLANPQPLCTDSKMKGCGKDSPAALWWGRPDLSSCANRSF